MHQHYWYPVSEPMTVLSVKFDEITMPAWPEPGPYRVVCECGAVEWR